MEELSADISNSKIGHKSLGIYGVYLDPKLLIAFYWPASSYSCLNPFLQYISVSDTVFYLGEGTDQSASSHVTSFAKALLQTISTEMPMLKLSIPILLYIIQFANGVSLAYNRGPFNRIMAINLALVLILLSLRTYRASAFDFFFYLTSIANKIVAFCSSHLAL